MIISQAPRRDGGGSFGWLVNVVRNAGRTQLLWVI
jgi:hypothetical protein